MNSNQHMQLHLTEREQSFIYERSEDDGLYEYNWKSDNFDVFRFLGSKDFDMIDEIN